MLCYLYTACPGQPQEKISLQKERLILFILLYIILHTRPASACSHMNVLGINEPLFF